ncbi:MAG: LysR family transcriptional regulator [Gammaproteobacteria bacterium]|nr:LysR family transcriptional regulator [Gammaproteobacteria bacterium]
MGMLDDTAIFTAVVELGGFSRAAKQLGLSNGLVSRRIAQLELKLGVTLIKRTTRQLQLTREGELFWQHAQRIQQELDSAVSSIQSLAQKPKGKIRLSAPLYFGRHFLTPIIMKFLADFKDIKIDLNLSNDQLDPIKEQFDLVIRGAGYIDEVNLQDSSLQMKLLLQEKIGLYASSSYLFKHGEPTNIKALLSHAIINSASNPSQLEEAKWPYLIGCEQEYFIFNPQYTSNDIESSLTACIAGHGIGRFTDLNVKMALQHQTLKPVLRDYDWGHYKLYAIYPQQHVLPKRTRLLLEFIYSHTRHLTEKLGGAG